MGNVVKIMPPEWAKQFVKAMRSDKVRRIVIYGGRGGGKSWTVATVLLVFALESKKRILCVREVQHSISDSVKKLLDDTIARYQLYPNIVSNKQTIRTDVGSEFIFAGMQATTEESIKSMEGIDYCWFEEAQKMSRSSWDLLEPTIRKSGSKLIYTLNPKQETDPVYKDCVLDSRPGTVVIKVNYYDNPWFWETALVADMEWDKENRPDVYQHIWEGKPVVNTEAQVFKGCWEIGEIPDKPADIPYYHGLDWGFANDPLAVIRTWIDHDNRIIYIDQAIGKIGVEIVDTADFMLKIPTTVDHVIRADSARPEMISHLKNATLKNGDKICFRIRPVEKGKGSIETGISFLKSYKITIAPELEDVHNEFVFYSYKVDKKTDDILPQIVDKHNHYIDALRYALEPLIKAKNPDNFVIEVC